MAEAKVTRDPEFPEEVARAVKAFSELCGGMPVKYVREAAVQFLAYTCHAPIRHVGGTEAEIWDEYEHLCAAVKRAIEVNLRALPNDRVPVTRTSSN